MPVYIVDTNVVVSGLIRRESASPPSRIVDAMLDGALDYAIAPDLLEEYAGVLSRPRLVRLHGLGADEIDRLRTDLAANATWYEATPRDPAPDPGDNHLWALIDAIADACLITGDALLVERAPANAAVISPRQFVERTLIDRPADQMSPDGRS